MLLCFYPPLSKGPLTGGQWMYVCVGLGGTNRQVTMVIKLLFQTSCLKVGLLFETEDDLGSCQTTTRVSGLAQKPTDDSYCWEMRRGRRPERPGSPQWEPVEALHGPLVPPLDNWCLFHHPH